MMPRIAHSAVLLAMLAVSAIASPALAAPRDDVRAGSNRCDAIADDRAWLDCYYGAAQPVRAALGLKPVPESQSRLVAQPPAGAPVPGDIPVRDQVRVFLCEVRDGWHDPMAWLPRHLTHVFGKEPAEALLREFDFTQ